MEIIVLNGKEYQLDIEQAKKLNLLKEKDSRVRSWEEFKKKYPNQFFQCLTKHESQALTAFTKLLKLRRDWIGDWEPDWKDMNTSHGVIWANKNNPQANTACALARPLSFPNYKMAQEFLETFSDLIEEAKTLI